jgi:putative nucleotidyltransferase with HDIG domain
MGATTQIDIHSLISTEIPPLPNAAMRVATLAQDANVSTRAIADAIGCDPALAARILRVANSPLYAPLRRITSLPMAVGALGHRVIYQIVIASIASEAFRRKERSPLEKVLWEHSVAVALMAREISSALGMRGSEEAFLCGLLHDIGKLLLIRHDALLYLQLVETDDGRDLLTREEEIYGYTHAQIGALVARHWELPEEIAYAIYHHQRPGHVDQSIFMARVVNVADGIANASGIGLRKIEEEEVVRSESARALRLDGPQLRALWEKSSTSLREMIAVFS